MASLFELLGWIQWDDLEGLKSRESGVFEYSTSKLELIMAMRHLNKQLKVFLLQQMLFESFAVIGRECVKNASLRSTLLQTAGCGMEHLTTVCIQQHNPASQCWV
jgi:hypothetical protein